jgi:nicotinamide-nucleotide amidase
VNAAIIAIGSELLTPFRQDTNSLFLTDKLNQLGVEVIFKAVVGDDREHLRQAAVYTLERADIVIFMGGLGPTEDDLTREAVAAALGRELKRDSAIIAELYARFAQLRVKMPQNNERQAEVISGAVVLPNPNGSAPGQWLEAEFAGSERIVILLPGPPQELKPMFDDQCLERLRAKLPPRFIAARVLKVAMIGESRVDARVAPIYTKYKDVQTTILAGAGEVQLHLRSAAEDLTKAEARVDKLAEALEDELGDDLFSTAGESLEEIAGYYLQMKSASVAVAESCTGGLLAQRLTSIAGSSRYFLGGAIVYSNELKTAFADVPAALIEKHGAVSKEAAIAMAEGIRRRCNSSFGIGVTGIAGPGGATPEKPVGLVFHAVSDGRKTDAVERKYPGDRDRVRWWASQQALDMLRRRLM